MKSLPGITYLFSCLPQLLLPPVLVHGLDHVCDFAFGISFPEWFRILTYVLSFPVIFTFSVLAADYRDRRQAALRGAVLPPTVRSTWPGGLDALAASIQNFKIGYMGMSITQFPSPSPSIQLQGTYRISNAKHSDIQLTSESSLKTG